MGIDARREGGFVMMFVAVCSLNGIALASWVMECCLNF